MGGSRSSPFDVVTDRPEKARSMPLTKPQVPLDSQTQALFQQARPLSDYTLRFINHQYPLLSMMYAMFAGGENALYCDYTSDFARQYLFVDPSAPTPAEIAKANRIGAVLANLDIRRQAMRNLPPEQQEVIQPNNADWDKILVILKEELTQNVVDGVVGTPVPPPPVPMW
jgi:hypothetical protein